MNPNDTIRLLILNDSRSEAERLISMLNNAGRSTRAQHVDSEEALTKLLQEQPWDLLIGQNNAEQLVPQTAIRQIQRLGKDVPVILMSEEEGSQTIVEGLKIGAVDVVRLDEDQHLLLVIDRELSNREQRQQRRNADRKFNDSERRSQELLDSSRDAIAFVQDGLFLYANESFTERYGYQDRDDIECMPVIDMVAESDQAKIKDFLKSYTLKGESEISSLDFLALGADGTDFPLSVEVSSASFDEEPCIQFISRAKMTENSEELEAQLQEIKHQDLVTGLFNRQYLIDALTQQITDAAKSETTHSFLLLEIDNFESQVQANIGVAGADMVLGEFAAFLRGQLQEGDTLARFSDSNFAIIRPKINADAAISAAKKLANTVEKNVIEIDGRTYQLTASVGIALINENSANADTIVDQSLSAIEKLRQETEGEGVGNGAKLYEPEHLDDEEVDVSRLIQKALDNNRFKLLFQPIISLRGSETEHYEVLLRMLNDDDEEISPDEFLGTAAEIGATTKIDRWVILESIKVLSEHRKKGNQTRLILNLSPASLIDESLGPWLGVAFKAAGLSGDSLVFQASEVDINSHINGAAALTAKIQSLGSQMSISKFGCALNPFKTLDHVKADFVKVDGSFTLDIQNNGESPEALTNLIGQLHERDKVTVVPFVENASVLSTLWQAGVHYIQGHYLQAPTHGMDYDFSMEE